MPAPEPAAGRGRPRFVLLVPFLPVLLLLAAMGATEALARDPQGPPGERFRPAPSEANAAMGLVPSEACGGILTARALADGAGRVDDRAAGCTHGLDLYVAGTAPGGYDANTPIPTPPGIPCYGSGPYVKVLYIYDKNGTSKLSKRKALIREIVAHGDELIDDSARDAGSRRHVRWLMDGSCKLKVVAVPADLGLDVISLRINLMNRGLLKSTEKGLAFTEGASWGSCSGIAEVYPDDRKGSTNRNNYGGMLALVYSGCWTDGPSVMMGTEVATHELFHTLGSVQPSAPNSTSGFHCTDESDVMCYEDGSGQPMRNVCPAHIPERLDCGRNDYFHPSPKSGSYLANYWNTARSRYLTASSPSAWDRLQRPSVSISTSTGSVISGTAVYTASVSAPSGASVKKVVWEVNGKVVATDTTSPFTLKLNTLPESGGYANGQKVKVKAWAVDNYHRWKASSAKSATVQNPKVRLLSPSEYEYATGDMPWSAEASAPAGRSVTKVELLVNGNVRSTDTTAPYSGTFNARNLGYSANLKVRVTDSWGVVRTSPARTVYIGTPGVILLSPAPGGWVTRYVDDAVLLAAEPVPVAGVTVARVQFLVNGAVVGTDTSAPFAVSYDTSALADGTELSVVARLTDARGHVVSSEAGAAEVLHVNDSVTLTSPASGSTLGSTVSFAANPNPAPGSTVYNVAYTVDGSEVASAWQAPWTAEQDLSELWLAPGRHVVTVRMDAYDEEFNYYSVESAGTVVSVAQSGSASIASPAANAKLRGNVTFKANLSGGGGTSYVEFWAGGMYLGYCQGTTSCSATWNSREGHDGTIWVRAVAQTPNGTFESAARKFSVANTRVALKAPASGATVTGSVTLKATATVDSETKVEWVKFYVDGKVVAKDRSGPFSATWKSTSVTNGTHKIKAVLVTTDGRSVTSPERSVTVAN